MTKTMQTILENLKNCGSDFGHGKRYHSAAIQLLNLGLIGLIVVTPKNVIIVKPTQNSERV